MASVMACSSVSAGMVAFQTPSMSPLLMNWIRLQNDHSRISKTGKMPLLKDRFESRVKRGNSVLHATKGEEEAAKRGGRKGFYVRPSKAVEMGGGFYVPGLEGSKIRVAIAVFALIMLGVNRAILPGYQPLLSQQISEVLTGVTALLFLGYSIWENSSSSSSQDYASSGAQGEDDAGGQRDSLPVVQCSERISGSQADDELWLVAAALQVLPSTAGVVTLSDEGMIAAYTSVACEDEACKKAYAACVTLVAGRAAMAIERGESAVGVQEVFALLPASCTRALLAGSAGRAMVVGLPGGGRDVSENEAMWLSQLSALPTPVS